MKKVISLKRFGNENGLAVVYIALIMFALIAFVGFAIDIGYMYVVKGQLQNAADSVALAGAGSLYPHNTSSPPGSLPDPDWTTANTNATGFVQKNKAAGASLVDAQIQYGYWNLSSKDWKTGSPVTTGTPPGTPSGYCSVSKNACTAANVATACPQFPSESCVIQDVPAFMATISKSAGKNGGPVPTFFAQALGFKSMSVGASAVAGVGAPGSEPAGGAFPFVLTACVVDDYFSRNPLPNPPTLITDTSVYHLQKGTDVSPGQWTDLTKAKSPSASLLKDYIDHMVNPSQGTATPAVQTGDPIWIDPGTKASVYHSTQDLIDAGKGLVVMPVVGTPTNCSITTDTDMTIVGFVAVQLVSTTNHSMTGQFVGYYKSNPGSIIGGPASNTVTTAKLIK